MPNPLSSLFEAAAQRSRFSVGTPGGPRLAWAQMARQVRVVSGALAREGTRPGDRIVYQGPQRVEAFILFWAAMLRGAVFVPLDDAWPAPMVARAAGALAPRVVVSSPARGAAFTALYPSAHHIGLPDGDGAGSADWDDWAAQGDPVGDADCAETSAAAYLFTSGSTGAPKAVVLSRRALATGARLTVERFAWSPGERLVNLPEPHTMSGLRNGLVATLAGDMAWTVVSPEQRGDIFALVDTLKQAGCERLVAGPSLVRLLAQFADRLDGGALGNLKAIYCTGAMLSPAAVAQFHAHYAIPIVNYYGLTETGGICVSQDVSRWDPQDSSLGTAAGADLRVMTATGPAPTGTGELHVRSGQLMTAYLDDTPATAARFDGAWLRTGDQAMIEADGRCRLIGRVAGFIKTASTDRVAPEEVEEALEAHPAVAEAAVVGVEANEFERIVALVVVKAGSSDAAAGLDGRIAAFVRERLGAARTPSRICFIERLPRAQSGKLARARLKDLLT